MTYPNPGVLPTKSAPSPGESIELRLGGLPSFKELPRSIGNTKHPRYDAFVRLREAATAAMDGRECYSGPIAMELSLHAPRLERPLLDYVAGVEDTLDGSHGPNFTYLPIVYQDGCQICYSHAQFIESVESFVSVRITLLEGRQSDENQGEKSKLEPVADPIIQDEVNIELNEIGDLERQAAVMGFESPTDYLHQTLAAIILR